LFAAETAELGCMRETRLNLLCLLFGGEPAAARSALRPMTMRTPLTAKIAVQALCKTMKKRLRVRHFSWFSRSGAPLAAVTIR